MTNAEARAICRLAPTLPRGMRAIFLAGLFVLAGCDTMPKTVNVPVPVPCLDAKDLPQRPPLVTDAELRAAKASNGARWVGAVNYQQLAGPYIADLERVAKACSK